MKNETKGKYSFLNIFFGEESYKNKWVILFFFIAFFVFILSLRFLSDPDLGFHLNTGQWIVENFSFPDKDPFTYTAANNTYIDLHWMFQVIIFFLYNVIGYGGLSIFVACLSMIILILLLRRNRFHNIPLSVSCALFFAGFLIIEPRIVLRPEMFSFIFIISILFILDNYFHRGTKKLYILPILMLLWCNTHSLFILGIAITGVYFISICWKKKKLDTYYLTWMLISFSACLVNPYFLRGFTFPLELFSRFDSNNIYNQHIKEFRSFVHVDTLTTKEILFLIFTVVAFVSAIFTLRRRKFHEIILLLIFAYLAFISLRNIPLFVIIAIPVTGTSVKELIDSRKGKKMRWPSSLLFYFLLIIPLLLLPRIITNAYYHSNNSFNKTGIGLDILQQPENASAFIIKNNLKGKILNSIGYGGWLEWRTQQPVFIDGRLEVMKEDLYNRIVKSWNNGLSEIINTYSPNLIVYNYQKYYTWTDQLAKLPGWKLVYLDGAAAIFSTKDTATIPGFDFSALPVKYDIPDDLSKDEALDILNLKSSSFKEWMKGFYSKTDFSCNTLLNIASFCFQIGQNNIAEKFFLEVLKRTRGNEPSAYIALAEIYRISGDTDKEKICLQRILNTDPENKSAKTFLIQMRSSGRDTSAANNTSSDENEAKSYFNSGNDKYRNGDIEGAIKDYNKAIELNPSYFKAYNNRAIIETTDLKKDSAALMDFTKAVEINPDYADAYLGRGTLKFNSKDLEGACKDWQKAKDLGNTQAADQIKKYCK